MNTSHSKLFKPAPLGRLSVRNRLFVAPMTRVSALTTGAVGPLMQRYYERFAKGGFGLIVTEGLYTDERYSQAYKYQPGMTSQTHAQSWKPIVEGVQGEGALMIAQLMHAGALSQHSEFTHTTMGPSSVQPKGAQMPFYYGTGPYPTPESLDQDAINELVQGFANSALLAKSAGFNGVEIHGANGYLLDQFLTRHTNCRTDRYGGTLSNRLRLYREIIEAVRAAVGEEFVVGVRFSQKKVNDTEHLWQAGEEAAAEIFSQMASSGVDYLHTTEPLASDPAFPGSLSLAALARKYSGLPVIANGGVDQPQQASQLLESGQADFVALGKIALSNQDWPNRVMNNKKIRPFDFAMLAPIADLDSASLYFSQIADELLCEAIVD